MKILFVGGTGIISSACSRLAVSQGHELDLLVRGESSQLRPPPPEANLIFADVRDRAATQKALSGKKYDAVVDFVAFTTEHIENDLAIFRDITAQLVFISSASAYHKPVRHLPITESTPLHNPFWQYSRDKIACEQRLFQAYQEEGMPITIVRPSHTYDKTLLPFDPHGAGGTVLSRIDRGLPVIVHGDGTSLWTLTHNTDFAVGLMGLLGHPAAIGEAFHITSDESIPWNEVIQSVARAAGKEAKIVHVASDTLAKRHTRWGEGLLGDKSHSVIFDNSKIKRLVPSFKAVIPFSQGAREIVGFYRENPERCVVNAEIDALMDELVAAHG
jgi:nucleoside-diphosphate-sugar epimerase